MTLEELSKNIEHWRQNKKSHVEPIPEKFWQDAIKLSKEHSYTKVARAARLSTSDLKKRLGLPPGKRKTSSQVNFQELKLSPSTFSPVLELQTSTGMIVRVYQ